MAGIKKILIMAYVDLTSKEWCDLVFEGKNKEFGAYEMRTTSTKRHNKAVLYTIIGAILVVAAAVSIAKVQEYLAERGVPCPAGCLCIYHIRCAIWGKPGGIDRRHRYRADLAFHIVPDMVLLSDERPEQGRGLRQNHEVRLHPWRYFNKKPISTEMTSPMTAKASISRIF